MSDDTIRFHVIQSVKGGCGKTAFSLMKSIQLAEEIQLNKDNKVRVLYLDCDLCGSALKVSLCGEDSEVHKDDVGYMSLPQPFNDGRLIGFNKGYHDCKTLIEFLEQTQQVDLKDIIVHGYSYINKDDPLNKGLIDISNLNITREEAYTNQHNITGKIDFIFLPSEAEKKNSFNHARIHSKRDVTLNATVFRMRMKELFQTILRYGQQIEGQPPMYTDVVLDMPPGGDVYSGELLKEIEALSSKEKIDIRYYNLTTIERGHMYTTVEHIAQLLEAGIEEKAIYCVFTEMVENEFAKDRKGKDKNNYEKLAKNFV